MNAPVLVAQLSSSAPQSPTTPKSLKLEKPQNGQAVTIHLDGNTKLDLSDISSEKLTFVRVGEKLIVLFDNQSTVTVDPVFDSGGHPLADVAFDLGQNRLVTGDEFATLFPITTDQSVLPAAGNSGPTGGANFSDAHVNALTDPNAPLALLGDENSGSPFGSVNSEGGSAPVANEPFANAGLNESNLTGGTAENAGLTTITGFLGVDFGTAASSAVLSFNDDQGSLATLRSAGEVVNFVRVADAGGHFTQLIGFVGADPSIVANRVFIVTLDATTEGGGYTVTLLRPLDHGSAGADTLSFALNVTATDQFGSAQTQITVKVQDDIVVLSGDVAAQGVSEDGLAGANGFVANTGSTGSVDLHINWGADNDTRGNDTGDTFGRTLSFMAAGVPAITGEDGAALSSGGVALQYVVTLLPNGGELLTAYKGDARGDDARVFTLTLDPTSAHGAYSFNLLGTLDHATESSVVGLTFAVQAADADGDTVDTNFTINVTDDAPVTAGEVVAHNVTEDGLAGANGFVTGAGATGAVDLNINWGVDNDLRGASANDTFGRTLSFVAGGVPAITGEDGATLSSGGVALQYVVTLLPNGGELLTAYKGAPGESNAVFTLTLDPTSEHGAYSFNLLGTLDHGASSDSIGLTFTVQAADADGDTVNTSFTVNVADDLPVTSGEPVGATNLGEDGLAGANPDQGHAPAASGPVALNIDWGTDNDTRGEGDTFGRTLSFVAGGVPAITGEDGAALSSGGVALQYVVTLLPNGGELLTAYKGDARGDEARVFTLTLDPTSEHGVYSFNLLGTLDHATGSNSIGLTFTVQAADADGDTVNTSFTVNVADDLPVTSGAAVGATNLSEDGLAGANPDQGHAPAVSGPVALNVDWGTDNDTRGNGEGDTFGRTLSFLSGSGSEGDPTLTALTGSDQPVAYLAFAVTGENGGILSSGGVVLQYIVTTLADGGQLLTAYKGDARGDDARVFTVTLDPTSEHGAYNFNLLGTLDHATGSNSIGLSFGVQAADADGDTVNTSFTVNVADDLPVTSGAAVGATNLSEDGLAGANPDQGHAPAVSGPVALNIDWGTDSDTRGEGDTFGRTLSFLSGNGSEENPTLTALTGSDQPVAYLAFAVTGENGGILSSGGVVLQYVVTTLADGGQLLTAYKGDARGDDARVFTVTLDPTSEHGAYSFNLLGTLDHATGSDSIGLSFGVQAADADGDTVNTSFTVNVGDDVPVIPPGSATTTAVDEDGGLAGGNAGGPGDDLSATTTSAGDLGIRWGADNTDTATDAGGLQDGAHLNAVSLSAALTGRAVYFSDDIVTVGFDASGEGSESNPTLTSNGQAVLFRVINDGTTLEGYVHTEGQESGGDRVVFTVSLSDDDSGKYTFTLLGTLDHPISGTEDNVALTFNYTARDFDGDTASATFTVTVNDDTPIMGDPIAAQSVDEDGVNGNAGDSYPQGDFGTSGDIEGAATTAGGPLNILWGADAGNSHQNGGFSGTQINGDRSVVFSDDAIGNLNLKSLTSDGVGLQYVLSTDGTTLTAYKGDTHTPATEIFQVTLSDNDSGSYAFSLKGNLDHPVANVEDDLTLTFGFTARDGDGDGDAASSTFQVIVNDDAPLAGQADSGLVDEDGGFFTGIPGGDGDVTAGVVASGSLGVVWGADNDLKSEALTNGTIGTVDDPIGRTVSFAAADGGGALGGTAQFVSGSLVTPEITVTDTTFGQTTNVSATLTSDGVGLSYRLSYHTDSSGHWDGGYVLLAYKSTGDANRAGDQVFKVTIDPTSEHGSYKFELLGNLDHPVAGTEDNLNLTFHLVAADADGDQIHTDVTVAVNDDSPITLLSIVDGNVEEEQFAPSGNEDTKGAGDHDLGSQGFLAAVTTSHVDGLLNIVWGADFGNSNANGGFAGSQVNGDRSVVFATGSGQPTTLSGDEVRAFLSVTDGNLTLDPETLASRGVALQYVLSANGTTLIAFAGDPDLGHKVFEVKLSDQGLLGTGAYRFDLLDVLDHPVKGDSPSREDALSFKFNFTARDGDGDTVSDHFTVNVSDDSPTIGKPESLSVSESTSSATADTFIPVEANGSLGIHWGADDNNSGAANRSVAFTEATLDALADLGLRSNGVKITYALSADDTLLTAKAGGVTVFTVQLSDASDNGSYTFKLLDNIDHHGNGASVQDLTFGFAATDSDGDTTTPASFTVSVTDDVPVAGVGDGAAIDEKFLLSGTDPHIFDLTVGGKLNIDWNSDDHNSGPWANRSVSFSHAIAADNVTVTDANGQPVATDLTSDGHTVNYAVVGGILYAYTTSLANPVFLVTLNDGNAGSYTFTLLGNLDHGTGAANYQLNLQFSYTATDSDGDPSSNFFTVTVQDDAPIAGVGDHRTVNENALSGGTSPDTPVRVHGDLNIDWGADHNNSTPPGGTHDRSVAFTDEDNAAANVTSGLMSNGASILYALIDGVLVGYTGTTPQSATDSNVVFNVSLSDSGDGSYTFTLLGNLDHPVGAGTNTLDLTFNYTATDSDGDSSSKTFTVTVVDDVPLGGQTVSNGIAVDEAALLTPSTGDNQISGDLNDGIAGNGEVIFGADGYKAGSLAIDQTDVTVFDGNGNVEAGFTLKSEGQNVKFVSDGTTLFGYVGATHNASYVANHPGVQVFKLVLDPATGGYTFTLLAPLDHTGAANNTDLVLGFGLKALDGDSDPVTFTLKLDVTDTVPTAAGGDASSIAESNTRGGTDPLFFGLFDPTSNGSLHVTWGADDKNSGSANRSVAFAGYTPDQSAADAGIGTLTSNGQDIHVRIVGTTLYGYTGTAPSNPNAAPLSSQQVFKVELTDSGEGSYKFTLLGNLDHPMPPSGTANDANTLTLHFNYTATDADGDIAAPASFDVTVVDDVLQLRGADHGFVAEGALNDGNGVGIIAGFFGVGQSASGSLGIRWGADSNDPDSGAHDRSVKFDTSLDHAVANFTSHGEQVTYSLSPDGLVLTAATSTHAVFTVTLSDDGQGGYAFNLQGPIDHGTSGLSDFLGDLNFGFVATDSDGDSKSGNFQITVIDDVPVAPGVTITGTLVHDESAGQQSAAGADDVAIQPGIFAGVAALGGLTAIGYASDAMVTVTPHDGADGHLSTALALTNGLGGQFNGAATNLFDTLTGHRIFLYSDASGAVFGRVGSGDGLFTAVSNGAIAFALGIDNSQNPSGNSGMLSVAEYRAISHPDTGNANDSVSLKSGSSGGDLLYVTASTTDFDHDNSLLTTTRPLAVSFLDDGPSAHDVTAGTSENAALSITLTEGTDYGFGADGKGSAIALDQATVTNAPNGFSFDASKLTINLVEGSGPMTVNVDPGTAFDALPAGLTATLLIPYTVTDGDHDSKVGTIAITVTGENDAPVLDLSGPDVAGNDVAARAVEQLPQWFMNSATISDVDSTTMTSLKVTLETRPDGALETLSLNAAAQAAVTNNGLSWSYDAATGDLKVAGEAPTAVYQTILKGIVYFNNDDNPDTTDRTVHVVVNDGTADSAQQTATIQVWASNDPPQLEGTLHAVMDEGGSHQITPDELGFTDPDNVASEVSFHVSNQVHGVLKLDGVPSLSFTGQQLLDGHVTFVHDGTETTSASFDVYVEDGNQDGSSPTPGHFTIDVTPANEAPQAVTDLVATNEDTPLTIPVAALLGNDSDANGDTLTVTNAGNGYHGIAAFDANTGQVTFTPDANFSGVAGFDYTVSDGHGGTATAHVAVDVAPVADVPVFTISSAGGDTPAPAGDEFRVNTYTASEQAYSSVAALNDGGYVVTWMSTNQHGDADISGQRFDSAGAAVGNEFRVNSYTTFDQSYSSVAALKDGGYVVTWSSYGQDGSGYGVFGQRFDATGQKIGGEVQINTATNYDQSLSSVAALNDGGYMVTWTSYNQDGNGDGVFGQRFDATGQKVGGEVQVNTYTHSVQSYSSVAALANGGYVVTWSSASQDGSGFNIFDQRFDATGQKIGGEVQVNTNTNFDQLYSSVAALSDGGYVVTWMSSDGSGWGIFGQRFDAMGVAADGEFRVNATVTSSQTYSSVAALMDGGYVVTWSSANQDGSGRGIYGQRFDAAGHEVGHEYLVNQTVTGNQIQDLTAPFAPTVAQLADGSLVSTWHGEPSVSGTEIYARQFDLGGASGAEDTAISLGNIVAQVSDTDGSEALVLVLSGFPAGATFSVGHAGSGADAGKWVIDNQAQIDALATTPLTMTPPQDYNGHFTLSVTANVTDTAILYWGVYTDTNATTHTIDVTVTPVGDAPVIDSNQGLDVVALSIPENTTAVTTVHAHDVDSPTITYAIQGGDDASLFQIDGNSGALTFKNAPDYENKLDANHDNIYQVIVTASDGSLADSQTINVAVTDVVESVSPPTVTDYDVSSGQYAFWNDGIQPSSISFDASTLFSGTGLTYSVTQAFSTSNQNWNWFHAAGSTIFSGDPDGNNQRGLYVVEVQAHNTGGTATTYVAFDVFGGNGNDGSRFDVIDNNHRSVTDQYRDNLVVLKPGVDIPDDVSGGDNHDVVIGNEFANRLFGSNGDDAIYGGGGNDYIAGGDNYDFLSGGAGDDTIYASNGNDFLLGDAGNDYLYGGDNNDVLMGGAGDDHLYGEQGNDTLYGGAGHDVLSGGGNADTFVFEEYGDLNVDTILDYSKSQNDKIDLSSILDSLGVTTSNFDNYVHLDNSGNNVKVQVDVSGQGHNWADVAVLQNYHTAGNQVLIELDHQTQVHTLTVAA